MGYFVWKITILRQKILSFSNFRRGGRTPGAPPPPWIRPWSSISVTCYHLKLELSCLWTYVSILYCCNCWYNYECIFVIAPWGTLIGIKYIVLYCIVLYCIVLYREKRHTGNNKVFWSEHWLIKHYYVKLYHNYKRMCFNNKQVACGCGNMSCYIV